MQLTRREHQVARLIAEGMSNKEIAARLGLSPNTVRTYVSNILAKLQVSNRAAVAAAWVEDQHAHEAAQGNSPPPRPDE